MKLLSGMRPILSVSPSLYMSHINVYNVYIHDRICGNAVVYTEKELTTESSDQNSLASSPRNEISMHQRYELAFMLVHLETTGSH